jgi:hypothetical protein
MLIYSDCSAKCAKAAGVRMRTTCAAHRLIDDGSAARRDDNNNNTRDAG